MSRYLLFVFLLLLNCFLVSKADRDRDRDRDDDKRKKKGYRIALKHVKKNMRDLKYVTREGVRQINESSILLILQSHCQLMRRYGQTLPGYCYDSRIMNGIVMKVCRRLTTRPA